MPVIIPRLRRKPRLGARLDMQHPLSRGLVGCWLFNEGGGSKLWDISGNANHGTLTNMDPSSDWGANTLGPALDYDGVNDCTTFAKSLNFSSSRLATICCRVRWRTFSNNDDLLLETSANYNANAGAIIVDPNDAGGLFVANIQTVAASATGYARIKFTRPTATWHHYAWVFDVSTSTFAGAAYVDGAIPAGLTVSQDANYTAVNIGNYALNLMCRNAASLFGDGILSDLRIYNRVLSAGEILQLYVDPYANILQPQYRTYFLPSNPPATAIRDIIGMDIIPWAR
jgi:hypothetical protein